MRSKIKHGWGLMGMLSLVCYAPVGVALADSGESVRQRSVDYVLSHSQSCTMGDGYRCQAIEEMQVLLNEKLSVPARYLLAWPVVYADFMAMGELSDAQKDLHHYTIGFAEDEGSYFVILSGLLLPALDDAGMPNGQLLRSTFGKSMRYEIDKQSLEIESRKFYR